MHGGAAELGIVGDLTGGGLEQRRAGEVGLAVALHADHVVAHAGHVGAAGSRGAVEHREGGQPRGREPGQAGKNAAAEHPHLHLVIEQVGAGALDQVDEGQLLLQRDVHGADTLARRGAGHGTGVDAGVVDLDHAAHAAHVADADDLRGAGYGGLRVGVVHQVAGHVADLEEGRTRIEEPRQPLPRQELPALLEARLRRRGQLLGTVEERLQALHQRQLRRAVGRESLARGADLRRVALPVLDHAVSPRMASPSPWAAARERGRGMGSARRSCA